MQSNIHFFKYLLRIIILLILFYYIFQLNYYRHWTSIEDQDFTLIHNSLLLNSDIRAEYHEHPGHTQILLMSLWLNFFATSIVLSEDWPSTIIISPINSS
jgi:hypothetical protein